MKKRKEKRKEKNEKMNRKKKEKKKTIFIKKVFSVFYPPKECYNGGEKGFTPFGQKAFGCQTYGHLDIW